MPSILDPNDHELSSADALSAACAFFGDFDRRVTNQQLLDAHVAESAKPGDPDPPVTPSEPSGEGTTR